jgi:hypothetical protein
MWPINRILRYDDIESQLNKSSPPVVVNDSFLSGKHHGWKYIAFGLIGLLYIPVSAPVMSARRRMNDTQVLCV